MKQWIKNHPFLFGFGVVSIFYFITHLFALTELPVFADESIYIRWSQLIIDEPVRYAFFPLNDGKTPLWMWLMVPFQFLGNDQLWSARFLSVLVGFLQMGVVAFTLRRMNRNLTTQLIGAGLVATLPFWFFHHRLALIDGFLTLWISLAMLAVVEINKLKNTQLVSLPTKHEILTVVGLGLALGLGFWTKIPVILAIPGLFLLPLFHHEQRVVTLRRLLLIGCGVVFGLAFFVLLKLNPAFGQLFGRGSDFLHPVSEVLSGKWKETVPSFGTYLGYLGSYLTWPILLLGLGGLFWKPVQKQVHSWWWAGWLFGLPIFIMGKVVYPRYLLPMALFVTIPAALVLGEFLTHWLQKRSLQLRALSSLLFLIFFSLTVQASAVFTLTSLFNTDAIPFVRADRTQYLTEWSSGHGIVETVELLNKLGESERLAVGTEGYFGTLPDALLLYLHRRPVDNIYVEGIGWPVSAVSQKFIDNAADKESQRYLLVVNSHRLEMDLGESPLLLESCRPFEAPCLQVWDITDAVNNQELPVRE